MLFQQHFHDNSLLKSQVFFNHFMGNKKLSHEMNIRVDYIQHSKRKGTAVVSTGQCWVFLNTHSSDRRHLNVRAL